MRSYLDRSALWSMRLRRSTDTLQVTGGESVASLLAAGDIVLSRGVHEAIRDRGPGSVFGPLKSILDACDLRVANLESTLTRRETQQGTLGGVLKAPPESVEALAAAGFDAVTVANNHCMDFGPEGLPECPIFALPSIAALPFLEYDIGYRSPDWRWRPYHLSYLVRLVLSRYPVQEGRGPAVSQEALRVINGALVRDFVQLARADGSIPLVLYLPGKNEFLPWAADPRNLPSVTREILRGTGVEYADLTPCVASVPEPERFAPDSTHYSPRTNAAIAVCLRDLLSARL
jgi:hypothetical protein